MALKDAKRCKAKAKNTGERCKNPAVTGFDVCRFHGAGSPKKGRPGGRPIVTGRYSKYLPERLSTKYLEARDDVTLLELRDEIALLDTRSGELLQNLRDGDTRKLWKELKDAWDDLQHAARTEDKQRQNMAVQEIGRIIQRGNSIYTNWSEVYSVTEQRRKTVESERKRLVEMQQMITAERAMLLIGAILGVIKHHVTDTTTINAIRHELGELAVIDAG